MKINIDELFDYLDECNDIDIVDLKKIIEYKENNNFYKHKQNDYNIQTLVKCIKIPNMDEVCILVNHILEK